MPDAQAASRRTASSAATATSQRASVRPAISAAIANANGTASADVAHVEHRRVGHHVGVLQRRVEPRAVGRGCSGHLLNGGDTNASIPEKKTMIPPSTATTHGISSRFRRRFWSITSDAAPVSTVSHSSSDPSWLAQSADSR